MGHKCQRRELSVLLTQEEGSGDDEIISIESKGDEEPSPGDEEKK